jgi:hypothetical protein
MDGHHTHSHGGGDAGLLVVAIIVIGIIAVAPVVGAIIHAITIMLMVLVPTVAVAGMALLYYRIHNRSLERSERPAVKGVPLTRAIGRKGQQAIPSAEKIADEVIARIRKELEQ